MDRPDPEGESDYADGAQDDAVHYVVGGGRRPGPVRLRTRQERRHPRPEGPRLHHPDPGRGRVRALRRQEGGHQGHRHPPRREDVRDAPDEGGGGEGHRHGQLLRRPRRQPRPELRQVLCRGRRQARDDRGVQLRQHLSLELGGDEGEDREPGVHPERAERDSEYREVIDQVGLNKTS